MIVQCRSCTMRYHLDDGILGSKGCQVRCTSCGHIWHQSPPVSKNMLIERPEEAPARSPSFSRSTKILIILMGLIFVGSGSFYLGRKSLDSLGPWFDGWMELYGYKNNKKTIEITSFSFQSTEDGNFICQGAIRNISTETLVSPKICILLKELTAENTTLQHKKDYVFQDIQLPTGESFSFSFSLPKSNCTSITATIP